MFGKKPIVKSVAKAPGKEWGEAKAKYKASIGRVRINEIMRPSNAKNIVKNQVRLARDKKRGALQESMKKNKSSGTGVGY